MQIPNTISLPADMDTTPLGYVQFLRVVEFYSSHPGLNRVRTLMRTPV